MTGEKGKKGKREKGKEGKRERGKEGKREKEKRRGKPLLFVVVVSWFRNMSK